METIGDHSNLDVESTSTVERSNAVGLPPEGTWEDLADLTLRDRLTGYVGVNDRTQPGQELAEVAHQTKDGRSPSETAYLICEMVEQRMRYQKGVTHVNSSAREAWGRSAASVRTSRTSPSGAAHARCACPLFLGLPRDQTGQRDRQDLKRARAAPRTGVGRDSGPKRRLHATNSRLTDWHRGTISRGGIPCWAR